MVYPYKENDVEGCSVCFRTTNCYGLSSAWSSSFPMLLTFPYNELLWFIVNCKLRQNKRRNVSVQRIVMVYRIVNSFTANITHCFRTTNCYGLSDNGRLYNALPIPFPYNELLWFIRAFVLLPIFREIVSVQRIVMVYH